MKIKAVDVGRQAAIYAVNIGPYRVSNTIIKEELVGNVSKEIRTILTN